MTSAPRGGAARHGLEAGAPTAPDLTAASERLRDVPGFPRRPGRPRKVVSAPATQTDAPPADPHEQRSRATSVPHDVPRLLDLEGAAQYLSIGARTVLEMISAGRVRRVRLPLKGDDELRKILIDRHDLDKLVDASKVQQP